MRKLPAPPGTQLGSSRRLDSGNESEKRAGSKVRRPVLRIHVACFDPLLAAGSGAMLFHPIE